MKFIDLQAQYQRCRPEIDAAIAEVLQHGQFIQGPEVKQLEALMADYVGVKQAIGVASGTTALQVALMALEIGPGDEVITTPFCFFATVEVIVLLGATPVFVDIDPKTYNLDPKHLEAAITNKTKAIMPVSLYGQCADFDEINAIANRHNIAVIEDGAQSFGAEYKSRRSCGLTTIGITSFFPSKPLGCYGDGGACFTNDETLAQAMRMIMHHGEQGRYNHVKIGMNGRLDTLQAAILMAKLKKQFPEEIKARQQVARWYQQYLDPEIFLPFIEAYNLSVFAQYTIEVDDREALRAMLLEKGIPTAVHYPKPLHKQPAMGESFYQQSFPVAERAATRVLSLPFHPYMSEDDVKQITFAFNHSLLVPL